MLYWNGTISSCSTCKLQLKVDCTQYHNNNKNNSIEEAPTSQHGLACPLLTQTRNPVFTNKTTSVHNTKSNNIHYCSVSNCASDRESEWANEWVIEKGFCDIVCVVANVLDFQLFDLVFMCPVTVLPFWTGFTS